MVRTLSEKEIRSFCRALAPVLRAIASHPSGVDHVAPEKRKRPTITRKRLAQLRLQGEYIGHIRALPPRQKQRAQSIRATKGHAAAIAYARKC